MESTGLRCGDLATYTVAGWLSASVVIWRGECRSCGERIVIVENGDVLTQNGRHLHDHQQPEAGRI